LERTGEEDWWFVDAKLLSVSMENLYAEVLDILLDHATNRKCVCFPLRREQEMLDHALKEAADRRRENHRHILLEFGAVPEAGIDVEVTAFAIESQNFQTISLLQLRYGVTLMDTMTRMKVLGVFLTRTYWTSDSKRRQIMDLLTDCIRCPSTKPDTSRIPLHHEHAAELLEAVGIVRKECFSLEDGEREAAQLLEDMDRFFSGEETEVTRPHGFSGFRKVQVLRKRICEAVEAFRHEVKLRSGMVED
jgi:hypothetical protein